MIRKALRVAVVSSLLLAPAVAMAQNTVYANYGQCESALKQMRNAARDNSTQNPGVFNQLFKTSGPTCQPVTDSHGNVIGYQIVGG